MQDTRQWRSDLIHRLINYCYVPKDIDMLDFAEKVTEFVDKGALVVQFESEQQKREVEQWLSERASADALTDNPKSS